MTIRRLSRSPSSAAACSRPAATPRPTSAAPAPPRSATRRRSPACAAPSRAPARAPTSTARRPTRRTASFVNCAKTVHRRRDSTARRCSARSRCASECKSEVKKIYAQGGVRLRRRATPRVMCCEAKPATGKPKAKAQKLAKCVDAANGQIVRHACYVSPFAPDACSFDADERAAPALVVQETVDIPSARRAGATRRAARASWSPTRSCSTQFGGASFSLNNARYTRHHLAGPAQHAGRDPDPRPRLRGRRRQLQDPRREPDRARAGATGLMLEVWAFDRRSNQLEDAVGLDIAEEFLEPRDRARLALRRRAGAAARTRCWPRARTAAPCSTTRRPTCRSSPNWTNLVFSRDIDAIVTAARAAAREPERLPRRPLGGHRLHGALRGHRLQPDRRRPRRSRLRQAARPGAARGRRRLDRRRAAHGRHARPHRGQVRRRPLRRRARQRAALRRRHDRRARSPPRPPTAPDRCRPSARSPTTSYSIVAGPAEPAHPRGRRGDGDPGRSLDPDTRREHPARRPGRGRATTPSPRCPTWRRSAAAAASTAFGGLGSFIDDDGVVAHARVVRRDARSARRARSSAACRPGTTSPRVRCRRPSLPNNGPAADHAAGRRRGARRRRSRASIAWPPPSTPGGTNFTDSYYPSSGLGVTSVPGVCTAGTCTVGNVGAACTQRRAVLAVDQPRLDRALGRPRPARHREPDAGGDHRHPGDRVRRHNGLAPVPGAYTPFAHEHRRRARRRAATARRASSTRRCRTRPSRPSAASPAASRSSSPRASRTSTRHGRGRRGQPDPGGARRLPGAQRAVSAAHQRSGSNIRSMRAARRLQDVALLRVREDVEVAAVDRAHHAARRPRRPR